MISLLFISFLLALYDILYRKLPNRIILPIIIFYYIKLIITSVFIQIIIPYLLIFLFLLFVTYVYKLGGGDFKFLMMLELYLYDFKQDNAEIFFFMSAFIVLFLIQEFVLKIFVLFNNLRRKDSLFLFNLINEKLSILTIFSTYKLMEINKESHLDDVVFAYNKNCDQKLLPFLFFNYQIFAFKKMKIPVIPFFFFNLVFLLIIC